MSSGARIVSSPGRPEGEGAGGNPAGIHRRGRARFAQAARSQVRWEFEDAGVTGFGACPRGPIATIGALTEGFGLSNPAVNDYHSQRE